MTWTRQGLLRSSNVKGSGTSLVLSTVSGTYVPVVGDLLLVSFGGDNVQTTDGDSTLVSSVTDAAGNTFARAREYTNGNGSAATGITAALWYASVTVGWSAASDTVTLNHGTIDARCAALGVWTPTNAAGGTLDATTAVNVGDSSDPAEFSITPSGGSREYVWTYVLGAEGPTGETDTADSANGWSIVLGTGTAGAGAASNAWTTLAHRIGSGSGLTCNHTHTARDHAQILACFTENAGAGKALPPALMDRYRRSTLIRS